MSTQLRFISPKWFLFIMQNFSLSKNYKILGIYCEKMKKEIHLSVHTCIEFWTLKDKPRELSLLLLMVIRGNFRD